MQPRVPVTFSPAGETVWVEPGVTVAEAARLAGVLLAVPCAGRGLCAGCGVRVLEGALAPADDVEACTMARAPEGGRLACRARVTEAVDVRPLFASARVADGSATPATPAAPRVSSGEPLAASASVSARSLVVGVDMGTTSVAALIVDASSGREIARGVVPNREQGFGADVLSRISSAQSGEGAALQRLAEESVGDAIAQAAAAGRVDMAAVRRIVIAGNSAMSALLVGADVTSLATYPFSPPAAGGPLSSDAAQRILGAEANVEVLLVPPIAAFVGGDALAATLAAGLVDTDAPRLLVDIGTNAELVLALPGSLLVASTAAGPAFEGSGISCGGPAGAGAVDRVDIEDGVVSLHAIEDAEPRWFSGAGLLSAVAALRGAGHLGADGLLVADGPLSGHFGRDADGVLGVTLSPDGADTELRLTQLDVRALQLAKAAVRAGIESLLRHAGLRSADLAEVLVAGAFGAALDPAGLVELGVLPNAVMGRTRRVGNAALDGASAMALDPALLELASGVASGAQHVDLATEEEFGPSFMKATEFAPYEA